MRSILDRENETEIEEGGREIVATTCEIFFGLTRLISAADDMRLFFG